MSILFEAANSEYLTKTAVQANMTAITGGVWFRARGWATAGETRVILGYDSAGIGFMVGVDDGGHVYLQDTNTGLKTTGTTVLDLNTWYYLWVTFPLDSGTGYAYLNGSETPEVTRAGHSHSVNENPALTVGKGKYSTTLYTWDGDLVGLKVWTVVRAASYANAEKAAGVPIDATSLLDDWHFVDHTDLTGHTNSIVLTATGTLSAGATDPAGYSESGYSPPILPFLTVRFESALS